MIYDSIRLSEGAKFINFVVDSGTSFPGSADAGEMFYKSDESALYVYNGSTWVSIQGFSGGSVANATTFNGTVDFEKRYTETKTTITSAATTNLDCSLGNVFEVNLNTSITTLTFSNVPASGNVFSLTLFINKNGSETITWPGSVLWAGAQAPTLTATAGKVDVISLATHNGGTTWYGFSAGLNF
jgi:hypothetical protein